MRHIRDYISSPIEYWLKDDGWFLFIQKILSLIVFYFLKDKVCHCFKFSKRLDYAFGYLILLNLCFIKSTDHCVYDLIPVNLLSVRICNTTKLCEIRSSLIRMNFQLSYVKNQKIK